MKETNVTELRKQTKVFLDSTEPTLLTRYGDPIAILVKVTPNQLTEPGVHTLLDGLHQSILNRPVPPPVPSPEPTEPPVGDQP